MNLETQIDNIRQEVGKPRKDRGLKVRKAAIRFEEHFRHEIFTAEQFLEWMKAEDELARFTDPAQARRALQQAGTRTDVPRAFEIVRIGRSSWALHPPESYFLRGDFPKALVGFFQKINTKVRKLLQALDWDNLDKAQRLTITNQYRFYKGCLEHVRIDISNMQLSLDDLSGEFLSFEQKTLSDHESQS